MKGNSVLLVLIFYSLFLFLGESRSSLTPQSENDNQVYIVYMGASHSTNGSLREDHAHILNTVLKRNEKALVHNYKHGFSGFAARLSKSEANSIAQQPGVVSVFPDPILKLHTTRSWDFLEMQTYAKLENMFSKSSPSSSDIVIGMLDTGIWPEAASFSDKGMGPIPPSWKGICMTSKDFNSSNCNRKIIGARYYADPDEYDDETENTVRDRNGHGTHTASTAAGNFVSGASYYDLAAGTAKGGSPESRLAIYKVCSPGCSGSGMLAAFDDAIYDGVDVLSLSIGPYSSSRPNLTTDPIAIGAFHAVERGIVVVCSAGNEGSERNTVINDAPWMLTVAATTIDRDLQSNIVLGSNKVIKGQAINFTPLSKSPHYPLVTGEAVKTTTADLAEARMCHPNSLDTNKVKGKIVICDGIDDGYTIYDKIKMAQEMGGLGLVHIIDQEGGEARNYDFPATVVRTRDAATILQYVNSTRLMDIHHQYKVPIWGWPSGWLGILEFAPPEVSGSIPFGANFGGLSPYRVCYGFKRAPASERWDWSPRISRFLDRIPSFQKKNIYI
ncbi:putative tripeptidyl-peptidase II [Medicago truncatula]|uniref:Putative tripeptidyl-peptidase II n=1 Tax=Medicago truncatula TaxID=3880 RepID=A0A396J2S5_MEDTR|nr:putative tripeptidyl-peptidase II [Medicago truncatula]